MREEGFRYVFEDFWTVCLSEVVLSAMLLKNLVAALVGLLVVVVCAVLVRRLSSRQAVVLRRVMVVTTHWVIALLRLDCYDTLEVPGGRSLACVVSLLERQLCGGCTMEAS